ncbi:G0/G1 switch protein 2-like [Xyrauchen texanus]|uniref:G0/G1 switch protein 2-like n=1 Tax=Xyrauchen texanus TaxID=154827 RepID=UPI002242A51C|nr:G0/G1 switch protein 2-like [Xyrauchen texanus]
MDIMETVREIVPFTMEILSQKASRDVLKVYLLGSVLTLLGLVIGLLELFNQPLTSGDPLELELACTQEPEDASGHREEKNKLTGLKFEMASRNTGNRLHAS